MIEFGKSLRSAREAKGLSVRQIAEQTRIAPTTVQDLESENFSRIAAPIYGRGFVKLYCEALGLDPKPYIDEFMEIFSGNRETDIRERPTTTVTKADCPPPADERPTPAPVPPPAEPDLFRQDPETVMPPPAAESREQSLSRYASPIRQNPSALNLSAYLRLGLLVAAALALLLLIVFGIRAIYRATTRTETPTAETAPAPAAKQAARTPQKIPSLYLD